MGRRGIWAALLSAGVWLAPGIATAEGGPPSALTTEDRAMGDGLREYETQRELTADLFLHQSQSAPIVARLFRLKAGAYRLRLSAGDRVLVERDESVAGPDHRISFDLPGATLVRLQLARSSRF